MTGLRSDTPKTLLTLSAAGELLPEDVASATAIERLLRLIARARRAGPKYRPMRKRLERRLLEYVWPAEAVLRDERDPMTQQLQRELVPTTETELRALWGDR